MAPRYTGQFYISVLEQGDLHDRNRRLFIGTADEAIEELQEEFKHLFPDDFDKKDKNFWTQRRMELMLFTGSKTQVMGRDVLGSKIIRIERYGPMMEEDENGQARR